MNAPVLTLDVDWAPDWVIDEVAAILIANRVRATWFVTHASPAIERLKNHPTIFELGIHPNFLPNSTQGEDQDQIIDYLLAIVPKPRSVRTHALFQSTRLLVHMFKKIPTLRVDVSIFTPHVKHWEPVEFHYENVCGCRFPYIWEDDSEMYRPHPIWEYAELGPIAGWRIMDFHPIHIVLNDPTMESYRLLKRMCPRLSEVTPDDVARFRKAGAGPRTMFEQAVETAHATGQGGLTISDLADLIGGPSGCRRR